MREIQFRYSSNFGGYRCSEPENQDGAYMRMSDVADLAAENERLRVAAAEADQFRAAVKRELEELRVEFEGAPNLRQAYALHYLDATIAKLFGEDAIESY